MESLRVILIAPPVHDFYATPARMEPLGLLYVKASLMAIPGVQCEIYDAAHSMKKRRIPTPASFDHLRDLYVEDHSYFSLLHHYYRFGDSFDRIAARVRKGNYDLVGISSMFTGYHPDVEALAARIKSEVNVPIAIGGWAAFAGGDTLAASTNADFLVAGDGETVFPELVRRLMRDDHVSGIDGLIANGSRVMRTERRSSGSDGFLRTVPFREQVYRFRGKRIARMALSRGCRFACSFCSVPRRYSFAVRSIESIARELDHLRAIGVEIVDFEDDNLFHDPVFSRELLSLLCRYRATGMSFAAMNGITATNLLPFVTDAIDVGFMEFNVSLVTGSSSGMRAVNRPAFREAIREIAAKCAGRIPILAFVIGGLPGTTPADLIDDIVFLADLPVTIGFSPLYLLPGLPVFEAMGLPDDARLMRGSALWKFGDGFTRMDIMSIWKFVRMINRIKTMGVDPTGEDRENLIYFSKSLFEKVWYVKKRDGRWETTIRFETDLPSSIRIADQRGSSMAWEFNNFH